MAIAKTITFEGNKYYVGNKDRVSAALVTQNDNTYDGRNKDQYVCFPRRSI